MKPNLHKNQSTQVSFVFPELPSALRYYDDFLDESMSVRGLRDSDTWELSVDGSLARLDFSDVPENLRLLTKHWCADQILHLAPASAMFRLGRLKRVMQEDLGSILFSPPDRVRPHWQALTAKYFYGYPELEALRSLLHFMCKFNVGAWSIDYKQFISTLSLPTPDKYASVRIGEVFLSIDEEAALVEHFDALSHQVMAKPQLVPNVELRDTTILICSFQFGLRPKQIGQIQMRDVRIWNNDDDVPSVHLTFKMAKQRSASKSLPVTRKVKREWAPLFVELYSRSQAEGRKGSDRLFGVDSSRATGSIIISMTEKLLPESRSATELRHTAAQRLVDAGANHEELAEFMTHADLDTGLVYFQTSANQAERVNQALGVSSVYQQVAKIAHDRFISYEELEQLKGEQQIAGVPHGIPISGIGGCTSGQPACPYNPVTSCYGCRKFMPLNDAEVHKTVLTDFRSIVTFFVEAGRGDENTPAYMQLKRTISSVQSVIAEIEEVTA